MEKNVLNTDLTGKVCVVTGAGGAICSMFSKTLAAAGGKVAVLDLNEEAAQKVVDEITAEGGTAKAYKANVLDRAVMDQVHEQILADFGPCDVLINGAGGNNPRPQQTTNFISKQRTLKTARLSSILTKTVLNSYLHLTGSAH